MIDQICRGESRRFVSEAANLFQRKSSAVKPAPLMMLFKVPIGICLFPCIATITWRPFK